MTASPATLLDAVREIAADASKAILAIYESDIESEAKDDGSPLTAADLAAHKTIVAGLQALMPDWPVLSEESSSVPYERRASWSRYWLVDPLDGTKEFIKRNGEFTVNIALIDNHYPILGVVHVPVSGRCYYAAEGAGAWVRDAGGESQPLQVRKLKSGPLDVVGSRSHASADLQTYLDALGPHELVPMGSSLKLCLVAEGKADIYPRLGLTSEWDTAAAQCVVEQAGGQVLAVSGERLSCNKKDSMLNPFFLAIGDSKGPWLEKLPTFS